MGEYKRVILLGDSLMVGVSPELKKLSPNDIYVDYNKVGMFLQTGLSWVRANMAGEEPQFLCISLGTNDWYKNFNWFKICVETIRKQQHGSVIIWSTIKRPITGVKYPYAQWNNYLRNLAKNDKSFRVADWVKLTNQHPEYLAADKIHATRKGYEARAKLYFNQMY